MRIKWFSFVRVTGLLLVLLYHFFQSSFTGGFIGVDIFFTFSGYLITALLIDEFSRNKKIDLIGFYKRRFYRIFPPLVLMVLVSIPFALLVRRDYIADIGHQIAAALGFMTNYFEILTGGSYESQFIPHLFLHTWSLAVEVHFYLLWGFILSRIAKSSKSVGRFRGSVFLLSIALLAITGLSMFVSAFFVSDFSRIYFSSFTHSFPFFMGSLYATLSGISDTIPRLQKNVRLWKKGQTLFFMGASAAMLLLLTFILDFNAQITYLFGFALASLFTATMTYSARVLHEQTPNQEEPFIVTFFADISYGIYLFHWPLYLIFSEMVGNWFAVLLTMLFSVFFSALSFYIIEPMLAGKKATVLDADINLNPFKQAMGALFSVLVLLMIYVVTTAPKVGDFETGLLTDALNQADNQMAQTVRVTAGDTSAVSDVVIIGDSVALRSQTSITEMLPEASLDAAVSRNFESAYESYMNYINSGTLSKTVVIAVGVNNVYNYEDYLQNFINYLPDGHRLIFVTPYNQSENIEEIAAMREMEFSLAEQYSYVGVADWNQVAQENTSIWAGTDGVHFVDTNSTGRDLYAQTIKDAITAIAKENAKGETDSNESETTSE